MAPLQVMHRKLKVHGHEQIVELLTKRAQVTAQGFDVGCLKITMGIHAIRVVLRGCWGTGLLVLAWFKGTLTGV